MFVAGVLSRFGDIVQALKKKVRARDLVASISTGKEDMGVGVSAMLFYGGYALETCLRGKTGRPRTPGKVSVRTEEQGACDRPYLVGRCDRSPRGDLDGGGSPIEVGLDCYEDRKGCGVFDKRCRVSAQALVPKRGRWWWRNDRLLNAYLLLWLMTRELYHSRARLPNEYSLAIKF